MLEQKFSLIFFLFTYRKSRQDDNYESVTILEAKTNNLAKQLGANIFI